MKRQKKIILSSIFFASFLCLLSASTKESDPWKNWLKEVDLIMTKAEKAVFKSLETEEDRKRFQDSFWKARDSSPETPHNEYKMEFYRRREYAETKLEGANSDRGQIYILLGEPLDKKNFEGEEKVVDCELWIYKAERRPELPPFMYLLFYRPEDFGRFRQFHPGLHSALDLITPGFKLELTSQYQAYEIIRRRYPELAKATVSIIPVEGDPAFGPPLTYSGSVIAKIYRLPEKEVEQNYLKNFASLEGTVDVTYSVNEIGGKGFISLSENRGFMFLNYSIIPDVIHLSKTAENIHSAIININLRIEDLEGKTIHQQERNINLEIDDPQEKAALEQRKLVFNDFAPIVEGEFDVSITFSNKASNEFFVYKERISITDKTVPVLVGFKIEETHSDNFMSFSTDDYKVLLDPRLIFNRTDSLEGLIFSAQPPHIQLTSLEDESNSIEIKDIVKQGNLCVFRQPLVDIKSENYYLSIRNEKAEIYNKIIFVLPFRVEKPLEHERIEPSSSNFNYLFAMALQHFNKGDADRAIEYFKKLPEDLWNSKTLPSIARAYYAKNDYKKVIELLEKENITKDYTVLLLLANSSLELNKLPKAAEYFEMLRKYGDTAKINRALGAIYYSLGDKEKANVYWDRAKNLEKKIK